MYNDLFPKANSFKQTQSLKNPPDRIILNDDSRINLEEFGQITPINAKHMNLSLDHANDYMNVKDYNTSQLTYQKKTAMSPLFSRNTEL